MAIMVAGENNKARRRTSTSVDPENCSLELLACDQHCSHNNSLDHDKDKPTTHKKRPQQRRLAIFTVFVLFSVLLFSLLVGTGQWEGEQSHITGVLPNPFDEPKGIPSLGAILHPQEHRTRQATIITLYWNITSDYRAPDGVKKKVYLINGEFPGPTIEARSGDTLVVHIENSLESSDDGLSIHWHGLFMEGYNAMDGAVGFTQCAIPPGKNFTYEFRISNDQHGTFWYHAHSQFQRADGLYGGLIIHQPDEDGVGEPDRYGYKQDAMLLVGDWYHQSASEAIPRYKMAGASGSDRIPDSLVVNGRGVFNCSNGVPARPVECARTKAEDLPSIFGYNLAPTRLRLINTGSLVGVTVGISHAKLTTLQLDGGCEIVSSPADYIGMIQPGERADMLIKWDSDVLWAGSDLEIIMDPENLDYPNPSLIPNQTFPIFPPFSAPSPSPIPPLTLPPPALATERPKPQHFNLEIADSAASEAVMIPRAANHIILLYTKTQKLVKLNSHPLGFINRTSWIPQSPPLISLPHTKWDDNQFITHIPLLEHSKRENNGFILAKTAPWVDLIINNLDDNSHPFHLHGHNFYVVARHRPTQAWGSYNPWSQALGNVAPEFKLDRPLRKDTVSVPRRGFVILRFQANNPGLWMVHSHVFAHFGSGMAMGLEIGDVGVGEKIDRWEAIEGARELCD